MDIINKFFRESAVSKEIKDACDSDIFGNIAKTINNDKSKFDQALNYLTEKDDISMKLRVMTLPVADKNALLIYLMTLDSSFATKINTESVRMAQTRHCISVCTRVWRFLFVSLPMLTLIWTLWVLTDAPL